MKRFFIHSNFFLFCLITCKIVDGQYKGGSNDGFSITIFNRQNISDAVAFKGGANDGFASGNFNRQNISDAISFKGGNDDGFAVAIFNRQNFTDATAFKGGNDDGFALAFFNRQNISDATAFKGGIDDGFAAGIFSRQNISDATAFKGGGNDGFTVSVYLKNTVLPIRLISFTGRWMDYSAFLNWQTASESNTDKFIIERSFNGNEFSSIGSVPATGNSNSIVNYIFTDEKVALSNSTQTRFFYRLKTIDKDGRYSYSAIIVLVKSKNESFAVSLYPNPANTFVNVLVEGMQANLPVTFAMHDIQGKIIMQKKSGSGFEKLDTYQLVPGQYFISVYQNAQLIKTIPLIIQH